MKNMDRLKIVSFRAVDRKELTLRYISEHAKVLHDIGVHSALKMDFEWSLDPESTIIAAIHHELGMVGGVRIQMGRNDRKMAMQSALEQLDPECSGTFEPFIDEGTAELCGLWVAHRFAGKGVPKLLIPAGVAVASQLNISSLMTFAAEYTVQQTIDCGFTRMNEVGLEGEFFYPVPNIRSYAMMIRDLFTLQDCPLVNRHRILSLRLSPDQSIVVTPKATPLFTRYELDRDRSEPMSDVAYAPQPSPLRLTA